MAYGVRLSLDDVHVRYAFSGETTIPEGVLVIPVRDLEASYVEGRERMPLRAVHVLGKAVKTHRLTGTWPERVIFQS